MRLKILTSAILVVAMGLFFYACQPAEKEDPATDAPSDFSITTESDEARQQYRQGIAVFDLGDRQRARTYFDKAIEADPDLAVAYVYRAWCNRSPQEYAQDTKMANEKNKDLTTAEQLMVAMNNTFASNDVAERLKVCKSMVEKYPEVARSYIALGNVYQNMDNVEQARKNFGKAIELRPDWTLGHSLLGASYLFDEPKDFKKAEEYMSKTVELMPDESRPHIALGDAYRAQQDLEKALASYQKAASLSPDDEQAYSKAGHAHTFLGNYEEARNSFAKSGTLSTFPSNNLKFIAYTHLYEGDHAKGMAWLKEQTSKLDEMGLPEDRLLSEKVEILEDCMWTAFYMENAEEMKALIEQIKPLSLEMATSQNNEESMMMYNAQTHFREGMLAVLEGDLDKAKEKAAAQKAAFAGITNPNKVKPHHALLGKIAMEENKYEDAVSHYEKGNHNNMHVKYMLAMANQKAGNAEKAEQLLKEISAYNFNALGYALVKKDVEAMLASKS